MNKRIILVVVFIVLACATYFGIREITSYKEVSFSFKQPGVSIDVFSLDENKIASVSENSTIKLKTGSYYYTPKSDQFASDNVFFDVNGIETVEINPAYSKKYLDTLLEKESSSAQAVINTSYPTLITNYIVADESLAGKGEWYSTKLIQRVSGGNEPDVYRIILKKDGDIWKIVVSPRLAISIAEFKQVPEAAIRQANQPLSNEAYDLLYPM